MKPTLAKNALDLNIQRSPMRQIMDSADPARIHALGIDPSKLISLVGGWVNHPAPACLVKAYTSICSDPEIFHRSGAYSPTIGIDECRAAIVEFEQVLYGMNGLRADHVVIGASSTHLMAMLLRLLLGFGDRMMLLDPTYCNFPLQLPLAAGAELLWFSMLDAETWSYRDRSCEVRAFILAHRPKVVVLMSPDNPTSIVPRGDFVEAALSACEQIGSVLIMDFAYKELLFGSEAPSYYSWGPTDNYIMIRSNSKWCRGLGRRLGWLEAPQFVVDAIETVQSAEILAPDTLHQMALAQAIREGLRDGTLHSYLQHAKGLYTNAAAAAISALNEYTTLRYLNPEGGLYVSIDVMEDGTTFVENLLRDKAVLLVPGGGFGPSMSRGARLAFGPLVNDLGRLREGIKRLGEYTR